MRKLSLAAMVLLALFCFCVTVPQNASATEDSVPFLLKGWKQPSDQEGKIKETFRAYTVLGIEKPQDFGFINDCEKEVWNIYGVDIPVIYELFFSEGDKVLYISSKGKTYLTRHEFNVFKTYLKARYLKAVDLAFDTYAGIQEKTLQKIATDMDLSADAALKMLHEKDGGVEKRKLLFFPALEKKDLVNRSLHIKYLPDGILGMTWVLSRDVYYDPVAIVDDHINGAPLTLAHELIHACPLLQNTFLQNRLDAELMASTPLVLHPGMNRLEMHHGYLKTFRHLAFVFSGFDIDRALSEIVWKDPAGNNLYLNEEKLQRHLPEIEKIAAFMLDFMRDTVMPEVFWNQFFWMRVNDILMDKNGYLKVIFSQHLVPNLPGIDPFFVADNRDRIRRLTDEAFRKAKEQEGPMPADLIPVNKLRRIGLFLGISEEDALLLLNEKYHLSLEDLKKMDETALKHTINGILEKEFNLSLPQK